MKLPDEDVLSGSLVTVSIGYGLPKTLAVIAFLEGYGIFVVAKPMHTA